MRCPACQAENRPGVRFCEACGAVVTMMRRLMTVVAAAAPALTPLAAALAGDQAAGTPTGTAKMRHRTAEVKTVDTAAKTLTVKRHPGEDLPVCARGVPSGAGG